MIGLEEQTRQLFRTARLFDEREAPSFQATLAGARRLGATRNSQRVLAAVTVMVVFAILSLLVVSRTRTKVELPSSRAVLYWESPTNAYLSAPGDGILTLIAESGASQAESSRP